ncbi:MAG: cytochrome c biogenesis protein CcsA [Planctomycetaceae bacterium]
MGFLAQVHIYCFLLSYLVSLACEILLVFRRQITSARIAIFAFSIAGFVAHTAFLVTRSQKAGLPPLLTSQQDWLLVLAWLGSLLYIILMLTHRQMAHGLFMLPAILLLVIVAVFVSSEGSGNLEAVAMRRWGMFHAASLVLGIGAVAGAAISGLMYLLHHQQLRGNSKWLQKLPLPSLENLTAWNRWMVVFSIPCLTIGLLTGFLLISWSRGSKSSESISWWDPTIVTTVIAWLAMVLFLVRLLRGVQQTGKSVAQLSLLSGGFLIVSVLGPMLLAGSGNLNTFHGRPRTVPQEKKQDSVAEGNGTGSGTSLPTSSEDAPREVSR